MQRAKYRDLAYFENVLLTLKKKYAEEKSLYEQFIQERGDNFAHETMEFTLSTNLVLQITTRYSQGEKVTELRNLYLEAADYFIKSWEDANVIYGHLLTMLSLGWLFQIHKEFFKKISFLVKRAKFKDYLVDYLLANATDHSPINENLKWRQHKAYHSLKEITKQSPLEAEARMKQFLETEWYTKQNLEGLYNSHKQDNKLYFGYWSFESGAIAKLMKLDDQSFQQNEYYPAELVHAQF